MADVHSCPATYAILSYSAGLLLARDGEEGGKVIRGMQQMTSGWCRDRLVDLGQDNCNTKADITSQARYLDFGKS